MSHKILLVAGEASGDMHGASLVAAMRQLDPAIEVYGLGGERLRAMGMHTLIDTAEVATMGFTEVFGSLGRLFAAYRRLSDFLATERPALVVLIDYPEFNLLLARRAKALGLRVFYYISPQVWAWRRGRIRKIAERVDRMAVVFPFEPELYNIHETRRGHPLAEFVGHPLLDTVRPSRAADETRARYGLDGRQPLLAVLPGSRKKELRYLLPPALAAARELRARGWQTILSLAHTLTERDLREACGGQSLDLPVATDDTYNVVHAADLAVVASGTATLETALLERPMVIMYRVSPVTYALARSLVRVEHIGMPNLILGTGVFPELIQSRVTAENIVTAVEHVFERREHLAAALREIRARLGEPGAARRAATMALELLA